MNKLAREAREQARQTGRLPHEILLDMARGIPARIIQIDPRTGLEAKDPETGEIMSQLVVPDLDQMKDAAKAAAPYYAPKISTVEVLAGASEHELDRLIAVLAAEAGVDLGLGGTDETEEGEGGPGEDGDGDSTPQRTEPRPATGLRKRTVTGT